MHSNLSRDEKIIKLALSYLGVSRNQSTDAASDDDRKPDREAITELIKKSILMLDEEDAFRVCGRIFDMDKNAEGFYRIREADIDLISEDLKVYFEGCDRICIIASTLGSQADTLIRKTMAKDGAFGSVLDATSGAYLECMLDEAERTYISGPRTFRFAPGYGDLALETNVKLSAAIDIYRKIGVTCTDGGTFIPRKTMLGMIGLAPEGTKAVTERSCGRCTRKDICSIRKGGDRCWI